MIYAEYEHRLALANAVDFDDLIGRTVELLRTDPAVAEYYHHRFRYILVDEYQDTNRAQYVLVRELAGVDTGEKAIPGSPNAGKSGPAWITVVGDSDQSIYAFRGADIRNIQDFEQDFPNAKTELSFDADHFGRGQRGDQQQRGTQAQETVDSTRQRRANRRLRGG